MIKSPWVWIHEKLTTGVHGAGANTLLHSGSTDVIGGAQLKQTFGASDTRLRNMIVEPIAGEILRILNASASPFSGAIDDNAGAHGGQGLDATHVPYDGDSNEGMFNGLAAYDGSAYWGQIILHNTTRSNSRKIVSVDRTDNVIVTTSSTDDWANDDVITVASQTTAGYFDVDVSAKVPATTEAVFIFAATADNEGNVDVSRFAMFHPYETYDSGKRQWITASLAYQKPVLTFPLKIISQKFTVVLGSGCVDTMLVLAVKASVEYADT